MNLKKQVFDQCILPTMTYGCQTWIITKEYMKKIRTAQRAMERKMLNIQLKDKIKCTEIREKTKVIGIVKYISQMKAKLAGHTARQKDNRWTIRTTDWTPRDMKRSRGRQARRWRDDLDQFFGKTWPQTARTRAEWSKVTEGYIQQWMNMA